jgi:hypothetical protein
MKLIGRLIVCAMEMINTSYCMIEMIAGLVPFVERDLRGPDEDIQGMHEEYSKARINPSLTISTISHKVW